MSEDRADLSAGTSQLEEQRSENMRSTEYEKAEKMRVHFRAPKPLIDEIDVLVEAGYFRSRSDAVREGLRRVVFPDYTTRIGGGDDGE